MISRLTARRPQPQESGCFRLPREWFSTAFYFEDAIFFIEAVTKIPKWFGSMGWNIRPMIDISIIIIPPTRQKVGVRGYRATLQKNDRQRKFVARKGVCLQFEKICPIE